MKIPDMSRATAERLISLEEGCESVSAGRRLKPTAVATGKTHRVSSADTQCTPSKTQRGKLTAH